MLSLLITEKDMIPAEAVSEVVHRATSQMNLRDTPLSEPDPVPNRLIAGAIERVHKPLSTYHFECLCGAPIITRVTVGMCPSCQTQFDLSAWGK
jgi:hypothetical protein